MGPKMICASTQWCNVDAAAANVVHLVEQLRSRKKTGDTTCSLTKRQIARIATESGYGQGHKVCPECNEAKACAKCKYSFTAYAASNSFGKGYKKCPDCTQVMGSATKTCGQCNFIFRESKQSLTKLSRASAECIGKGRKRCPNCCATIKSAMKLCPYCGINTSMKENSQKRKIHTSDESSGKSSSPTKQYPLKIPKIGNRTGQIPMIPSLNDHGKRYKKWNQMEALRKSRTVRERRVDSIVFEPTEDSAAFFPLDFSTLPRIEVPLPCLGNESYPEKSITLPAVSSALSHAVHIFGTFTSHHSTSDLPSGTPEASLPAILDYSTSASDIVSSTIFCDEQLNPSWP